MIPQPWMDAVPESGLCAHLYTDAPVARRRLQVLALLVEVSKEVMGRIPPTLDGRRSGTFFTDGSAFPSGHTAGTLVSLLLVSCLVAGPGGAFPSRVLHAVLVLGSLATAAVVAAITVGLGWHWPTDTVGGALLAGVVWSVGRALLHSPPRAMPVRPVMAEPRYESTRAPAAWERSKRGREVTKNDKEGRPWAS